MMTRRGFLGALAAAALPGARAAQDSSAAPRSNLFAMAQDAYRPTRRPRKPGARASMTAAERDALEHRLRCQCGCTLDVYTCRTTDFSCAVSPAMHRDVMALVEGGYGAREILDAFTQTYGERVLTAPTREGFNLVGWVAPFAVLLAGAAAAAAFLRRSRARAAAPAAAVPIALGDATPEELARLEAAVRGAERG
jgi:cytochrome c-type biogenesis protein CcmH